MPPTVDFKMESLETLDEQLSAHAWQLSPAQINTSVTPEGLRVPVPLRPLTIPTVPDFILEDDFPPSDALNSNFPSSHNRPSSSRRSLSGTRPSRNRGPDHVPRPPNPFILFACHVRSLPDNKGVNNRELSKRAGDMWNELSDSERAHWKAEAQKAKENHAQRYPGYRYQPRRRDSTSSEKGLESEAKRNGKNVTRRRPPPLTLQHEELPAMLYPAECFTSTACEFGALQTSASIPYAPQQMSVRGDFAPLDPCGNYALGLFDHTRTYSRTSNPPLSASILNDFHLLSLQTPPSNVQFFGVDFSTAYPSPVSPGQFSVNEHSSDATSSAAPQASAYYRFQ